MRYLNRERIVPARGRRSGFGRALEIGAVLSREILWMEAFGFRPWPDTPGPIEVRKTGFREGRRSSSDGGTRSGPVRRHFSVPRDFADCFQADWDSRHGGFLAVYLRPVPAASVYGWFRPWTTKPMFARRLARSSIWSGAAGTDRLDGLRAELEDCLKITVTGRGFSTGHLNCGAICPGLGGDRARFTGGIVPGRATTRPYHDGPSTVSRYSLP